MLFHAHLSIGRSPCRGDFGRETRPGSQLAVRTQSFPHKRRDLLRMVRTRPLRRPHPRSRTIPRRVCRARRETRRAKNGNHGRIRRKCCGCLSRTNHRTVRFPYLFLERMKLIFWRENVTDPLWEAPYGRISRFWAWGGIRVGAGVCGLPNLCKISQCPALPLRRKPSRQWLGREFLSRLRDPPLMNAYCLFDEVL